jgi:hypothetical protein
MKGRYWEYRSGNETWQFGWTTGKEADGKFHAFIRTKRYNDEFRDVKTVSFAKRWKAKNRAFKFYCEKSGKEFRTLHRERAGFNIPKKEKGQNPFQKEMVCMNNKGIEDRFDLGITYLGRKASKRIAQNMLYVEDKFGKNMLVDPARFQLAEVTT